MVKLIVAVLAFFALAMAAPVNESTDATSAVQYRCANEQGDQCPEGWTCCGPILPDVGGTCRKLNPGQFCIF
ncbi:hypothetical protein CC1G_08391 [Coprinopsis cinerea okayama7|uniref:CBM1 domain-containing protein n=1 Tax=Coprinopsis cinerea (strain Okayama-7 / 130 / ATCC MYA-4618 / FGSC 9003) TaxID=240176 RepID=A8NAM2_COPC7|nr:hypothetical protein CC1G_08391 [Coprinopsis cinerea okayama7\|eukprot:XP_001831874.1 hypothetical protein CC1G_08391 [Coprinopsis cinerea okayama7\